MTGKVKTGASVFPALILLMSFLISLGSYVFDRPEKQGYVFFFPHNSGRNTGAERRGIPARPQTAEQIGVFLSELFLGPFSLGLDHVVPPGTKIRHVMLREQTVYVDLDSTVLQSGDAQLSGRMFENLSYNLRFNFPEVLKIIFTIEGQQVNAPVYIVPENGNL